MSDLSTSFQFKPVTFSEPSLLSVDDQQNTIGVRRDSLKHAHCVRTVVLELNFVDSLHRLTILCLCCGPVLAVC